MSKTSALILILVFVASLAVGRSATAQRADSNFPGVTGGDEPADNFLSGCQDSLLLEPFPILRMLIDLISQLLDLLNQADQMLNGIGPDVPTNPSDLGSTIPNLGSLIPGTDGTDDLPTNTGDLLAIPGSLPATDALPGGWGIGPILSVQ